MCTTANNREIIEPRIIQLVRELTAAPATDEVADALKPVMEQVVDQAASSSQGGKRLRALLALDAFDILAGDVTPDRRDAMIDWPAPLKCFRRPHWCMTTSSTNPICAGAGLPHIVPWNRPYTAVP